MSGTFHVPRFSETPLILSILMDPHRPHKTLSLIILKLYSGFCWSYHEDLSSCTLRDSQSHTFFAKKICKNNLDYINLQVVHKDQSHYTGPQRLIYPIIMNMILNLNAQLIHQRFGHAYHQHILKTSKLEIYTGFPKSIPKLSHPRCAYIIVKGPCFTCHNNAST